METAWSVFSTGSKHQAIDQHNGYDQSSSGRAKQYSMGSFHQRLHYKKVDNGTSRAHAPVPTSITIKKSMGLLHDKTANKPWYQYLEKLSELVHGQKHT